jgi:hypothetical protein
MTRKMSPIENSCSFLFMYSMAILCLFEMHFFARYYLGCHIHPALPCNTMTLMFATGVNNKSCYRFLTSILNLFSKRFRVPRGLLVINPVHHPDSPSCSSLAQPRDLHRAFDQLIGKYDSIYSRRCTHRQRSVNMLVVGLHPNFCPVHPWHNPAPIHSLPVNFPLVQQPREQPSASPIPCLHHEAKRDAMSFPCESIVKHTVRTLWLPRERLLADYQVISPNAYSQRTAPRTSQSTTSRTCCEASDSLSSSSI